MSRRRSKVATSPKVDPDLDEGRTHPVRPSVAIFVVVALTLLVVYSYPYAPESLPRRCLDAYLAGYAHAVGAFVRIFDRSIRVDGNLISGRISLLIVRNCDAASILALFLAALVAYPARFRQRLVGATLGLVLLFVFNLVRIASVYFIGISWPGVVELVHWQVWPPILLIVAALSFLAWVSWTKRLTHPS